MEILSWNIQAAKGVDDVINIDRIANDIKQLADADVICLQEVLVTAEFNQPLELSKHFPKHTVVFGPAIDRLDGTGRLKFGNLILCRLPLLQIIQHRLPQPAEPIAKHMPRQAIEVIVDDHGTPVRIMTTHLEFFASQQRSAQVDYVVAHHKQCVERYHQPSPEGGEQQFASLPETAQSIYCGDFNLPVGSPDYDKLIRSADENTNNQLIDCWPLLNSDKPHDPTCGIFDHVQWQEGAHCRDFFFSSQQIADRVRKIEVDTHTAASDHQPLMIALD